jgi:hypothetical protein
MRFASFIAAGSVAACVLSGCEKQAATPSKATARSIAAAAAGGGIADTARAQSLSTGFNGPLVGSEATVFTEDTVGDPLVFVTRKIDTTITLGAWLRSHPDDKIDFESPVLGIDDPFCRAATANVRIGATTLVRSALFYIPAPPQGEKLPTDTARAAKDYCELRTMVLTLQEKQPTERPTLGDSLTLLVDRHLGPHREGRPLGAGALPGSAGEIWRGPGTTVIVATRTFVKMGSSDVEATARDTTTPPAEIFALAYAPGSGVQDFDTWESRFDAEAGRRAKDRHSLYLDVDSAITWAAIPGLGMDLETVVAYARARDPDSLTELRPPQVDAALLRALRLIHDSAPSLPPARRAAAFLAGDIVVYATLPTMSADTNRTILRSLASLGISFDAAGGGEHPYNHAWLWEAYRVDSLGRAGRAAFAQLLALGWPDNSGCRIDQYRPIIEHGEAELGKGDDNPLIHFYVGSAYKSMYDLAHFTSEDFDLTAYRAQGESARLKGIEHFRTALQSLSDSRLRREAWTRAMRLILQRSGEQPEYVCFED